MQRPGRPHALLDPNSTSCVNQPSKKQIKTRRAATCPIARNHYPTECIAHSCSPLEASTNTEPLYRNDEAVEPVGTCHKKKVREKVPRPVRAMRKDCSIAGWTPFI